MASNFKSPPALNENSVYEQWKKEIAIWQAFTADSSAKKHGPSIFITLSGKAREAVLRSDVSKLTDKDGVKNVISKLDTLYLEDTNQAAYAAYENFEHFQQSPEMNMKDFINELERLYNKLRVFNMELPDGVLAYRVLKSENSSTENEKLAKVTIKELTYKNMCEQLRKIFVDISASKKSEGQQLAKKTEPTFEVTPDSEEAFYGNCSHGSNCYCGRGRSGGRFGCSSGGFGRSGGRFGCSSGGFGRSRGGFGLKRARGNNYTRNTSSSAYEGQGIVENNRGLSRGAIKSHKRKNPLDSWGNRNGCAICESIFHWAKDCPHNLERQTKNTAEESDVELFTNSIHECYIEKFVGEMLGCAVLNSGCTKTVRGSSWLKFYEENLQPDDLANMSHGQSDRKFKLGDGRVVQAKTKVKLSAYLGEKKVLIKAEVVDSELLLLLSKLGDLKELPSLGESSHVMFSRMAEYSSLTAFYTFSEQQPKAIEDKVCLHQS